MVTMKCQQNLVFVRQILAGAVAGIRQHHPEMGASLDRFRISQICRKYNLRMEGFMPLPLEGTGVEIQRGAKKTGGRVAKQTDGLYPMKAK